MRALSTVYVGSVDYQEISADPLRETSMSTVRQSEYVIRYLYSRSSESQNSNTTGQDALTFRYSDKKIAFAICDGVGQSFNGQLAAQFIVQRLLGWIWNQPLEKVLDKRAFSAGIRQYLESLREEGTRIVKKHSIPQNTPRVVSSVLEEMRFLGSETTFICGCIYLPDEKLPQGGLTISWLGDTGFRVLDKSGQFINLPAEFRTGQHWSTKNGLSGKKPNIWSSDLSNIGKIAVFSDGLMPIADIIEKGVESEIINDSAQAISKSGASDDLSYWEISMDHQEISWIEELEPPVLTHIEILHDRVIVKWQKSPAASSYKISYLINELSEEERIFFEHEFTIPVRKWRIIKLGLQARNGSQVSQISAIQLSRTRDDKFKLLVASLIIIATAIIVYLIAQGK